MKTPAARPGKRPMSNYEGSDLLFTACACLLFTVAAFAVFYFLACIY